MKPKTLIHPLLFGLVLLACACFSDAQTVVPLGGLGAIQVFDNNGNECTSCVLYTYQAGTLTQQATYTDFTAQTQNTNPITFGSGGRSTVWLTNGAYYKFVLCLQNDGSYCAPADVLFSIDQVLAGSGSSGGGGGGGGTGTFTGTFISGSVNPATSGILELASGDNICWRNAAGTSNFCLSKDTSDVLDWGSGTFKMPMVPCSSTGAGYVYLCSAAPGRLFEAGNGNAYAQLVIATQDINTSDQVIQLHFAGTPVPLSAVAPTPWQLLQWNGTTLAGYTAEIPIIATSVSGASPYQCQIPSIVGDCIYSSFGFAHLAVRLIIATEIPPSGCTSTPILGIKDLTSGAVLLSGSPTAVGINTVTGSAGIPAGDTIGVGLITPGTGCTSSYGSYASVTAIYQ